MWDTVSLGTMAAAYHSTRASFFRCLSLFRETGLLEPTPYNERSSLSLSRFQISHFSSGLIAHQNSSIRVWFTPIGNRRSWFRRSIWRMSFVSGREREKIGWTSIPFLSFRGRHWRRNFTGWWSIEINELYLVAAQRGRHKYLIGPSTLIDSSG